MPRPLSILLSLWLDGLLLRFIQLERLNTGELLGDFTLYNEGYNLIWRQRAGGKRPTFNRWALAFLGDRRTATEVVVKAYVISGPRRLSNLAELSLLASKLRC